MTIEEMRERYPYVFEAIECHGHRIAQLREQINHALERGRKELAKELSIEMEHHFQLRHNLQKPIVDILMHSPPKPIFIPLDQTTKEV